MSGYKYEHTELLQIVYEANKNNLINNDTKNNIKAIILSEDPVIEELMKEYDNDKNTIRLISLLIEYSNYKETEPESDEYIDPKAKIDLLGNSPQDEILARLKKAKDRKKNDKEKEKNKYDITNKITICESGISPKIFPHPKKKYQNNGDDSDEEISN